MTIKQQEETNESSTYLLVLFLHLQVLQMHPARVICRLSRQIRLPFTARLIAAVSVDLTPCQTSRETRQENL